MNEFVDLRHVRYFREVAREQHFGRAAELLGISQAPLSQQIRQLEERLGVRLFNRTTRSVSLTEAGVEFLKHSEEILRVLDYGVLSTRKVAGIDTGKIRAGGVGLAVHTLFPEVIAEFKKIYPKVLVEIFPFTTSDIVDALSKGELDVGFIRRPLHLGPLESVHLMNEGFSVALHRSHSLANRSSIRIRDLKDESFVGYKPLVGNNYFSKVLECCREAGFEPRIVEEAAFTKSVTAYVGAGMGIGVMPESSDIFSTKNVVFRKIEDMPKAIELLLVWPRGKPNRMVEKFIYFSKEKISQIEL